VNVSIGSILSAWVGAVVGRPWITVFVVMLAALLAGVFAANTLRLQGDVTELVDSDASFLRNYDAYKGELSAASSFECGRDRWF
jgi:predicted RND superfamily exporter protein